MATAKLLYRSKKENAELKLRLLFSTTRNHIIETGSKIRVKREIFEKYKMHSKTRDIDIRNEIDDLTSKITALRKYVLTQYNNVSKEEIDKAWLKNTVRRFYDTQKNVKSDVHDKPQTLVQWSKKYIKYKNSQVAKSTQNKSNVILNYLVNFENHNGLSIYISDVGVDFIEQFKDYMVDDKYDVETINRAIKFIKTICKYAKVNGLDLHNTFPAIKLMKKKDKPIIFLSKTEINELAKLDLQGYDDIVRDWFIIGCNIGQRFSDFIGLDASKIRKQEGQYIIDVIQKKGTKPVPVPLNKTVMNIIEKYDWSFPQQISLQYFNERIKIICRMAKINEMIYGSVKMSIAKNKQRSVYDMYPKHKLVASHTCRRSFATNYFGKMPTGYIRIITGHSTEKALLIYIGKSESDIAVELARYLD